FPCNSISCVNTGDVQTFGLPRLVIQGFQDLGDAFFVPLLQFDNTFQYNGTITYSRGSHNIKAGGGLIRRQFTIIQSATARGAFTFNGSAANAQAPIANGLANGSTPNNAGAGFANFLLGAPVTVARNS